MSVCKVIAGSLTEWEWEGRGGERRREREGGRVESDGGKETSRVRGEMARRRKGSKAARKVE